MKQIKITAANRAAIESALAEVNGKAKSFTITDYTDVALAAAMAEEQLVNSGLPKAQRAGAAAVYIPAGPSARSYKYSVRSTALYMVRRPSGWYLESVGPDAVQPKAPERLYMDITQSQAAEIQRRALMPYTVHQDDTPPF